MIVRIKGKFIPGNQYWRPWWEKHIGEYIDVFDTPDEDGRYTVKENKNFDINFRNKWIERDSFETKFDLRKEKLEKLMIMKKYTIDEIKKYLLKQDSMGDILYNLSEENMDDAQEGLKILDIMSDDLFLSIESEYILDDDDIKIKIIDHMESNAMELGNADVQSLEELLESLGCYIPDYEF